MKETLFVVRRDEVFIWFLGMLGQMLSWWIQKSQVSDLKPSHCLFFFFFLNNKSIKVCKLKQNIANLNLACTWYESPGTVMAVPTLTGYRKFYLGKYPNLFTLADSSAFWSVRIVFAYFDTIFDH